MAVAAQLKRYAFRGSAMHRQLFIIAAAICCQGAFAEDIPISMTNFGPVSVGSKVEDAYKKLGLSFTVGYTESDPGATECNYYHPSNDLSFKVEGSVPKIMRIETSDKRAVTPSGIRVGDPISKVKNCSGISCRTTCNTTPTIRTTARWYWCQTIKVCDAFRRHSGTG